ncbi:MAG: sensor histidine kinase [Limisphaerales bacterium]
MNTFAEIQNGSAFICDTDGRITRVLQDGLELFAGGEGESIASLVSPENAAKAIEFLKAVDRDGAAFGWELEIPMSPEGRIYFTGGRTEEGLLVAITPSCDVGAVCQEFLRMLNEQTNALRSSMKELSMQQKARVEEDHQLYDELSKLNNELVTLQRELAKKNAELARANALKTRFLGMASHDLRKPLSVLLMYAEFLSDTDTGGLDSRQLSHVDTIRKTSETMLQSINDFLDIAQIESGRLKLTLGHVDFADLVKEQLKHQENFARAKNIVIQCKVPDQPLIAQVDARRMQQVIVNLVENAIKYSPEHTRVEVEVSGMSEKILLTVRDQGIGIPPEAQKNLFNPFVTAEKPTGGEKSTGLGLAIVKAIVTEHKGAVWLESEPQKGTTFYLTLPRG